jgi:hypothetical protein
MLYSTASHPIRKKCEDLAVVQAKAFCYLHVITHFPCLHMHEKCGSFHI